MPNSFQLIDVIIVIGICQGIFLSLTLQRITNNNRRANNVLSSLIVIATFMLVGRFLYFRFLSKLVFEWSLFADSLVFLFGPLLYLYVLRLLFREKLMGKLPLGHFIPFFGMLLISLICVVFYSPEAYYQSFVDGDLRLLFKSIVITGIVSNSYYLIRSFFLISDYKKEERNNFSFDQSPINYLYFFLASISLFLLAWVFSFINASFFDRYFLYIGYNSVWVAIPVFIYVIGYFSLKQPELFRLPVEKKVKEKKDRLSEGETIILKEKLDSLMINEKLFLQNDLTLKDVAETLLTSTNNISWLLNRIYETTFYDFINGHRIKEFIAKVQNKEHLQHTILALSMDVGFNSKSTFNKAFKLAMKETPSNFIKNYRAA